jgi:sugar lactone lactonase YvrE
MKHLTILIVVFAMFTLACQKAKKAEEKPAADSVAATPPPPVTLKLKWETDTLLTTCESVIYDKDKDVLYVANINGQPDKKDGNGFISKVSLDGKVTDVKWVKGMDAPKGMGLANGKLYVADIDRVHEIDVKTGKISKTYKAPGAKFLNDITTDNSGRVYISDMMGGTILVIEKGKLSTWMEKVDGPNGLLAEEGSMLMLSWNAKTLNSIDLVSKAVSVKTDGIENPDGIEAIGDGAHLVSSWNGMINYISPEWKKTLVLDTRADSLSSADIEYIQEKNLLLIPTFFKNKVMAYELTK